MPRHKRTTDGYKDRLSQALARGPRPMSVRGLAEVLRERYPDLRGTSYGGVRLYTEPGDRPYRPRLELLRAIADVLGVREDWLAFNDGSMTEAEEHLRSSAADAADRRGGGGGTIDIPPAKLEAALLRGLPALARASSASWHAVVELYSDFTWATMPERVHEATSKMLHRRQASGNSPDELHRVQDGVRASLEQAATHVGRMIAAGAVEGGVDLTRLWEWELNRYIQASVQALSMLFRPSSPRELRAPQDRVIKGGSHAEA